MNSSISALIRIAKVSKPVAFAGFTSLIASPRSCFTCLGGSSHPILVQKRPALNTASDLCVVFISGFHGRPFGSWGLADFSPDMAAYRFLQPSSIKQKFDFNDMAKSAALVLEQACNEHNNVVVVSASAGAGLTEGAFNALSQNHRQRIKGLFLINPVGADKVLEILLNYRDFPLLARGDIDVMQVKMQTLHRPIQVRMSQVQALMEYCRTPYPHFGMEKDLVTYKISGGKDPLAGIVSCFKHPASIAGRVFNHKLPDQGHALPAGALKVVYRRFLWQAVGQKYSHL